MNKRDFLSTTVLSGAALSLPAQAQSSKSASPTLLTVTGEIGKGNRGPIDPTLDRMMVKRMIGFNRAHVFDFTALTGLPAVTIKPTLEYDLKAHTLRGPLLTDVLKAAGVSINDGAKVMLRAVDGYAPTISMADARKYRFIIATHLDGKPMALGGLGPLWAVFDADRFPDMVAKKVTDRFALCSWGLYHIDVSRG